MISKYNCSILNDTLIKKSFGSNTGGIDLLFQLNNYIFMIVTKWDNGIMSVNNVNQYLKACNVIETNLNQKYPSQYLYVKMIVSKNPVKQSELNKQICNVYLEQSDINGLMVEASETKLIELITYKLYNLINYNVFNNNYKKDEDTSMNV
jgi:hypothetical protein